MAAMFNPLVAVLCRGKRFKRSWSAYITRRLNREGIHTWRVTPTHVPHYAPENFKVIINYGTGTEPIWWDRVSRDAIVLNPPSQVRVSAHKTRMMNEFARRIPGHHLDYTTSRDTAQGMVDDGATMVSRTLLTSHSGRGIVLSPPEPLPDARLYTKLKRGRNIREYRVFLYDHQLIDVVQKKRKGTEKLLEMGVAPADVDSWWQDRQRQVVRSWPNGWAFCHNNLNVPADSEVFADIANACGRMLSWGCVDVLVDHETLEWWAVEINSAPGLDAGNTQDMFISRFINTAAEQGIHPALPHTLSRSEL